MANHKIEIRRRNVEKILLTAEQVLAEKGYGATLHIWAVTLLNGGEPLSDLAFEGAVQTVTCVILRGIGLEP